MGTNWRVGELWDDGALLRPGSGWDLADVDICDVVVLDATGGYECLGLVVNADDHAAGVLHVMVLADEVDVAAAGDLLLRPTDTGFRSPVLALTALHAKVPVRFVRGKVAEISEELLYLALDLCWSDLAGDADGRRFFGDGGPGRAAFEAHYFQQLSELATGTDPRFVNRPRPRWSAPHPFSGG